MATLEKRNGMNYSRIMIRGKRVHVALDKNERVAREMLHELEKERNAGRFGRAAAGIAWKNLKHRYLAWAEGGGKKKYTIAHDRRAIINLEAFQRVQRLEDVTPHLLEDLRLHLKKKGKNAPVINREIQSLKAVMRWAESRQMVGKQDWSVCKKFPMVRGRVDFYSAEEYAQLLAHCKRPNEVTLALLCGRAGLRCAEAYYARWQDVDFKRGVLTVLPREGWAPKTAGSVRHIPLAKDLRRHLEAVRKAAASEYLVAEPKTGWRPSSAESMGAEFGKNVIRGSRLRGRLHILRHTFASHLAQAGVPLYTISKLLGHSSIRMTEIYAHLCPDNLGDAIDQLPVLPRK